MSHMDLDRREFLRGLVGSAIAAQVPVLEYVLERTVLGEGEMGYLVLVERNIRAAEMPMKLAIEEAIFSSRAGVDVAS